MKLDNAKHFAWFVLGWCLGITAGALISLGITGAL